MVTSDIIDIYGRTFSTLRISLTGTCNLSCTYCVPEKTTKPLGTNKVKPLPYDELYQIVLRLESIFKFKNVRLTGGEPTLYPDILPFIKLLRSQNLHPISMTTNGYLLKSMVHELKQSGIDSINISLDTLKEPTFNSLARSKSLFRILDAIDESLLHGIKVKINMVVMRGVNSDEILDMLQFCGKRGITLRYLELMKMGHLFSNGTFEDLYFSENEILELISTQYKFNKEIRIKSSTSNYWTTDQGFIFGIIANESNPFCGDCDRLRLDSFGNLFGCLSKNEPISIATTYTNEKILKNQLVEALAQKQPLQFTGSPLSMIQIGG